MSSRVFVVYRQFLGFLLIAPVAFFSRNRRNGCRLTWKSFWLIFLLSFVGVTANHNAYYMGMSLVTSSVASAMYNLAPAITFIMAYSLGLEKVNMRSKGSMAKIIGTMVCVSGAAVMALIQGPKLLTMEQGGGASARFSGCFLVFASACFWSLALILQGRVNEWYPDYVSMTAWMCLLASLQSGIFTFLLQPTNLNPWTLTSPIEIISCFFAGLTSAITFFAQAWCVAKRGPLFSALFQPLCTLIVVVLGYIFLHEDLYLGSFTGGLGVIIGLYIVLWGKAQDNVITTLDLEDPLLPQK